MIRPMTDIMVDLEGEHSRPVTMVVIEEVKGGDWGVGGKAFSCADVKASAGGSRNICLVHTKCYKSLGHPDSGGVGLMKEGLAGCWPSPNHHRTLVTNKPFIGGRSSAHCEIK
jgi:4-oxalocrotonate tautomerase